MDSQYSDYSDSKQNPAELLKKLEMKCSLFENLLNHIPEPVFVKNELGEFVFVNLAMADMYQVTPGELLKKQSSLEDQFFPECSDDEFHHLMAGSVTEGVQFDYYDAFKNANRHFEMTRIPFVINREKYLGGFAKDISETKLFEQRSHESERRWNYAQQASGECLWDWDLVPDQIQHSQQWSWMSGIEENHESFLEYFNKVHLDDRYEVKKALDAMLEEDKPYDKIFRIYRKQNDPLWVWDRGRVTERDKVGKAIRVVGAMRDVSDIIAYQSEVERLAFYDHLTGLPNRERLQDRLEQAIKHYAVSDEYFSVLFLDLDMFKFVNDTHGHQVGDELLKEAADRIGKLLGPEDTLARFAGDEFVVILHGKENDKIAALHYAEMQSEKIHKAINSQFNFKHPELGTEVSFKITTSIGIALCESDDQSVEDLLRLADLALYRAKEKGRNCSVIFNPEMQSEMESFIEIETALRKALEDEEFVAFYQPKVSSQGAVKGAEMLIRWQKSDGEIVGPDQFLQVAEETSLITQIGCWMLRKAIEQLQIWQTSPQFKNLELAVNISAKQLQFEHFASSVISMVQAGKVDPDKLTIEVTETVVMTDIKLVVKQLTALREFGIHVAIDDFGTGYSSLGYLKQLPVDKLKIDRSFVNDLLHDDNDAMLIKTIIDLGQNFNIDVIAEGVENLKQLDQLSAYGCQIFQGFHFSRPVPLQQFEDWTVKIAA